MTTSRVVQIIFLLLFAGLVWFIFIRQVPQKKAVGTITGKALKSSEKYSRTLSGAGRDFRSNSEMTIAEMVIFNVKVPGMEREIRYSLNTVAAQRFNIGDEVEITWEERGVPLIWWVRAGVDMKMKKPANNENS